MKKTVLHIINSVGRGGAEKMLESVLEQLHDYENIVVTLFENKEFAEINHCKKFICLNLKSIYQLPVAILKLRSIIKDNNVVLVHSHLYWANFTARFATPKKVALVTTIHTSIAFAKDYKKWIIRFLDRISYHFRKSTIIAVANGAHEQYFKLLNLKKGKSHILHTFVDTTVFKATNILGDKAEHVFKVITVGTLRYPKNHLYLIAAFSALKEENIELHIYGAGPQKNELELAIKQTGAKVILKGDVKDLQNVLPQYNLFVMASLFEGFSLSVLEAMAMQMPMMLSDIPSFREQADKTAVYFDLNNENDFVFKLKTLVFDKTRMGEIGLAAKERVLSNFTLQHHMDGLRKIYSEELNENK